MVDIVYGNHHVFAYIQNSLISTCQEYRGQRELAIVLLH